MHLINTTLAGIATEELNLVNAVKSAKGGATIPALVEALEAAQARRKEGEARLAQLNQFEVDAKEYQAKIAALRERWKDWEGALQGDGEKDLDLARQFIKKLLVSPVFIIPLERGSWRWETVGSYEGPLQGFVGKRPADAGREARADCGHHPPGASGRVPW